MKRFLQTFLMSGIFFGAIMGLFAIIPMGWRFALQVGAITGGAFGLFMAIMVFFLSLSMRKKKGEIKFDSPVIFDDGANHFFNGESVGGWLYLTEHSLVFQSHSLNVQRHRTTIPLEKITRVGTCMSLGVIPNGLEITTRVNVNSFVVFNRRKWVYCIKEAMEKISKNSIREN